MHHLPADQRQLVEAFEMQTGLIGLVTLLALARAQITHSDQYVTWTMVAPYVSACVPATSRASSWRVYIWAPLEEPDPCGYCGSYECTGTCQL